MAAKIRLHRLKTQEYRFDLIAGNRALIASSEEYSSKADAMEKVAELIRSLEDDERFEVVADPDGKYYFTLNGMDDEPIISSLKYSSVDAVRRGIEVLRCVAVAAKIVEVQHK